MYFVLYKGQEKHFATQEELLQKIQETNCDTIKVARDLNELQDILNISTIDQFGNSVVSCFNSCIDKIMESISPKAENSSSSNNQ